MNYKNVFNAYIKLFEGTFSFVRFLRERVNGLITVGLLNEDPLSIAHDVGLSLLHLRYPVRELPIKVEGERFRESVRTVKGAILEWRDPPIWDDFEICKICRQVHPNGIDPWTKERIHHVWIPVRVYTVWMRFRIIEDDST